MKDKTKYYRLGSPATAAVASELMKDEDIRSDVKRGVRTGFSIVGTTAKVLGIALLGTVVFLAGRGIVRGIKKKRLEKKALNAETAKLDKKQITKDESWFDKQVSNLRKALELDTRCISDGTRSYNEDTILAAINGCSNAHDWMYLCKKFGSQKGKTYTGETEARTLIEWLGYDDETDIGKYNAALDAKSVPFESKITQLQ